VTQDTNVANPQGALLVLALLDRLPALTDELLKCVLEQSEIRGKQSDIYGDDRLVPIDDLHRSLQDNLTFIFSNLGRAGTHDLAGPRRTGRRRAEQGAPLAAVQSSYQLGFRFMWDTLVAEAHQTGIVTDAELVGIASEVWMLNTLFITELATAYRDALIEQLLCQDQERSALVEALLEGRIGDTATVWEAADLLGLPYQGVFVVVAAEVPALARHALPRVQSRLQVRGMGSAWRLLPELEVGIVSLRSQRNTPALVEILRSGAVARIGVSPVYTGLERTLQALHLARIALASSPAGEPAVNVFDDAPLPVLVVSSPATSYRIAKTILGPLLDMNLDERDMLLNTLAAYFAFEGSAVEAGKHLYCHPNTVRHRLHRIERQTGRSLQDPRSSAELFIALEALRRLPEPAGGYA
jgi:hypothetical protein